MTAADRFVAISGCSGGGKSTLLAALAERGFATVAEPGRRLLADGVLPWGDPVAFVRRAADLAIADYASAALMPGWVFFDRGVIDAASALTHLTGEPALTELGQRYRYHRRVFLAPPWPDIYVQDDARRHGLDRALAEHDRLARDIPTLGYDVLELPRTSVAERVVFVLATLDA